MTRISTQRMTGSILGPLLAGLVLSSCASAGTTPAASGPQRLQQAKSASIAVSGAAPSSYLTPDGQIAGVEPEVAVAVLKGLGVDNVSATKLDFSAIIPGLQASQFDIGAGSLFMKQSRCAAVLFSEPIFVSTYSLATLESLPGPRPEQLDQALAAGLRLGVQAGTLQEGNATENGFSGDHLVVLPDLASLVDALKAGRIDAIYDVQLEIEHAVEGQSGFVIGPVVTAAPLAGSGVIFRKGDEALRDAFNEKLAGMKQDGTFAEISAKYGIDPAPALKATTAELCKNPG